MKIYCATTNPGKLREFRLAASHFQYEFDIDSLPDLRQIPPCEETGATFEENAVQKALYYGTRTPEYLFVDDSGLEVDALGGEPGVWSARFAGPGATDEANNRLLLDRLKGETNRTARFVCVIALVKDGNLVKTFRGTVEGEILYEPRGSNGFGYDPLFWYPPFGCTLAEVEAERKMDVSHRGKALKEMLAFLSHSISTSKS